MSRLMDHYALRPSFLPSLSGLHMRIYQFSCLLKQHLPELSSHFAKLGVEPAYLSQWFLSCFAVTCPLSMLFRIYDVVFAEGANETVMRVALALMRRNEQRMLATNEFEDVMQLLLGRGIWDCYARSADELVDDFTSLGSIITHSRLTELEKEFETQSSEAVGQSAGFLPDVQAAAGRFLGRLWAPSHSHMATKSTSTLAPQSAERDSLSSSTHTRSGSFFLRRSPSKQSMSTVNESNLSDDTTVSGSSTTSTAPTELGEADGVVKQSILERRNLKWKPESLRTPSATLIPSAPLTPGMSKEHQELHGQIEDLLTALSEMQREHAQLTALLQKEREDRSEDHMFVRQLVERLQRPKGSDLENETTTVSDKRRTLPPPLRQRISIARPVSLQGGLGRALSAQLELASLVGRVEERLETTTRSSASFETKAHLRSTLARTREQLDAAETQNKDLTARLTSAEISLPTFQSENEDLRTEIKELRVRVNDEFKSRQQLEHTIREMKAEARSMQRKTLSRGASLTEAPTLSRIDTTGAKSSEARARAGSVSSAPVSASAGGLRELKLGRDGRRDSVGSTQSLRLRTARQSDLQTSLPQLFMRPPPAAAPPPEIATSQNSPPATLTVLDPPAPTATSTLR